MENEVKELKRVNMKYYTPEIEEFHVGFECEFKNSIQGATWNKEICDVDTISICYDSFEHEDYEGEFKDTFRVKYLDKEDIESLEFKFLPKNSLGNLTHRYEIKESFTRIDGSDNGDDTSYWNLYLTHYPDRNRIIIKADVSCGSRDEKFFEGRIKNKSELKKLLKQLNIQ